MAISESKLRNIKSPYNGKPELSDRDGLTARITKHGVISFNFRFQWLGKPQLMKLVDYSKVKLSEAQEQVIKIRCAVFYQSGRKTPSFRGGVLRLKC